MRVFTGEGAGGQGRAALKGEQQRKPGQGAGLFEWSAVRCRPTGRGSEEQQNERAGDFYKKVAASDTQLARLPPDRAARAPTKICAAKFRGEKEE